MKPVARLLLGLSLAVALGFWMPASCGAETSEVGPPLSEDQERLLESLIESLSNLDLGPEEIRKFAEAKAPSTPSNAGPPDASRHWAYLPPHRPDLPEVRQLNWCANPIDRFILSRLEQDGLTPSPPASKERWLRRVYFDLIGLPPNPNEVEEFLEDNAPQAEAKVVDRLLDSPHYGERQAQFWLDLARFADSGGYHVDPYRSIWPYRDWVVAAFNRDLSFDRFTIEQLAGDLLPDPSRDQLIATGFHRNTMFNEEGGIDPEEFRVNAIVDRVGTTATVWLGTTLACAQCHDHKFDPFSQVDFYRFYALFNNTPDLGGGTYGSKEPQVFLLDSEKETKLADLRRRIAEGETQLETSTKEATEAQENWEKGWSRGYDWKPLDPVWYASQQGTVFSFNREDRSLVASGPRPTTDIYTFNGRVGEGLLTALRIEILPATPGAGLGRHPRGTPGLSEVEVFVGHAGDIDPATAVALKNPTTSQRPDQAGSLIDKKGHNGWVADTTEEAGAFAYLEFASPLSAGEGTRLKVVMTQRFGRDSTLARFRISVTTAPLPVRVPPSDIRSLLPKQASQRTEPERLRVAAYHRSIAPLFDPIRAEIAIHQASEKALLASVSSTLVLKEMETPRMTAIHRKGDFLNPGDPVGPGIPAVFHTPPSAEPRNRLDLAEWLVGPENPLTARVAMNRLWEQFFGRGLVETSEDFGTRGSPPSHPELLDWLATEFVRSGWSMKAMRRLLVTSATYRQTAKVSADLYRRDPYNLLLARGPRFRLDAEAIRDNALAVSGLLSLKMGGPSVFPYQPEGLWSINSPGYGLDDWHPSKGEDRFRRGLYTFWRKSNPYPAFVTFDAPSREYCTVKRARTNTPLQALNVLNDPVYEEASVALATRILECTQAADTPARVSYAFRLCLGREPSGKEAERLIDLYEKQLQKYASNRSLPYRVPHPETVVFREEWKLEEVAAWSVVGNVLLNLDEMLTKG